MVRAEHSLAIIEAKLQEILDYGIGYVTTHAHRGASMGAE